MELFWGQGYGATTPQQLAERLQIGKGSMYAAFGGKRELYEIALRRYLDLQVRTVGAMLASPRPAKDVLRRVLRHLVKTDLEKPDRRGCFATNSAVEFGRTDQGIAEHLLAMFGGIETAFRDLIERGQREGDVRPELHPADTASMLLNTTIGLHALARVEPGRARLLRIVDATIDLL